MNESKLHMGMTEWILLIILSVLWGGSFFLIRIAIRDYPPFTIVLGRVGIAAVIMTLWVYRSGERMPNSLNIWYRFIILGAVRSFIPFCLIVWAETHITSSLASILNATTPIFTMILAHFLTRDEPLTPTRAAGVLIGFGGAVLIIGPDALRGLSLKGLGQIAILGAAFSYGFSHIYGRRLANLPASVLAAGMLIGATLLSLPPAVIMEKPWSLSPGIISSSAVLGLAILSTALGYLIYYRILRASGANNASLVTFFIPVSGILLGVSVLKEELHWNSLFGLIFILLGLLITSIKHNRLPGADRKLK